MSQLTTASLVSCIQWQKIKDNQEGKSCLRGVFDIKSWPKILQDYPTVHESEVKGADNLLEKSLSGMRKHMLCSVSRFTVNRAY